MSVKYDIDALIAGHADAAKLFYALWSVLIHIPRGDLLLAEKVILDAWSFDSAYGNGIVDIIINENYDVVVNGLLALDALEDAEIRRYVDQMRAVFEGFSVGCASSESFLAIEQLSGEMMHSLCLALSEFEAPYLEKIWGGLIISAARHYLELNLDSVRARKK